MTELDLLLAIALGIAGCLLSAGGALWIGRKDNARPHPAAGE